MKNIMWNTYENDMGVKNSLTELVSEKIKTVNGIEKGSERVMFMTETNKVIALYHEQDCCEDVDLYDFEDDVVDWVGATVISVEEVVNNSEHSDFDESCTWTFYKIETDRGGLWMRWLGTSNGYYSESVDIIAGIMEE